MKGAVQSGSALAEQSERNEHVPSQPKELLTQKDICERFGISDETWRRWRQCGRAPAPEPWPVSTKRRPRWLTSVIENFRRGRGQERRHYFDSARKTRG